MFLTQRLNRALIKNASLPMRGLKLHEYQAGALLDSYKVPTAIGRVAFSAEDAFKVCSEFPAGAEYVVKAQVLTGGRGLGTFASGFKGGVHIVDTAEKVQEVASKMLGDNLITKQSGPAGFPCNAVYTVEKLGIASEFYLSLTLDRVGQCPTFIYSAAGGMNIEDVAEKTPELVFKLPIVEEGKIPREEMVNAAARFGVPNEVD
jgi:succinyl-CoA synthetase beta subunit